MDSAGRFTTKVAKYKNLERTSNNILKLKDYQQKLQQTEQDLSRMKRILECELSKFIQHRGEHLQPSITGWVSANMLYVGNNLNSFTEDEHATGMAKHQRDDLQQEMFDLIDGLCIVNSSHWLGEKREIIILLFLSTNKQFDLKRIYGMIKMAVEEELGEYKTKVLTSKVCTVEWA